MRGAPAIALVGALSLVVEIQNKTYENKKSLFEDIKIHLKYLVSARPTAVNIKLAAEELTEFASMLEISDTSLENMKDK